jgi:L-fucose mutarotase
VTHSGPNADVVFLNLAPGMINATDVLDVLADVVPIEAAEVMAPDSGPEPSIFAEFRSILGPEIELQTHGRFDFYDSATEPDVCLAIATGEQRIYANVLLTIGVIKPA